jgi:microsomal dipeptidase-like Zn-dependent dipeptidase
MDVGYGRGRSYRGGCARVLATSALLLLVWMGLVASPAAASPCGDPGQRACCNGAGEFSNCGTACNSRAKSVAGCSGDCQCGGSLLPALDHCEAVSPPCGGDGQRGCCVGLAESCTGACPGLTEVNGCSGDCGCSNSHCRQATPCGGDGQRACCGGELINARSCADGNVEVSGCTGDCFCGGSANPLSIDSSGHCIAVSHCGGDGERACCVLTAEFATNSAATVGLCESGKFPVPGCEGDCQCGGPTAVSGVNSLDTCITVTACGGANQRACCVSERPNPCDDGLQKIPGCTGDCFCYGGTASDTCVTLDSGKLQQISQPDTGRASAPTQPRDCALRGYADIHVHMFSDTGHGGGVLSGAPYDPANDNVNVALRPDYGTHRDLVTKTGGELPTPSCPSWIGDCGEKLFHGDHFPAIDDPVGTGTGDDTHSPLGAPVFNGWPTWHTTTHQQVYYRWLERAYQGGLRLISMLAVTNEALCLGNKHLRGVDCADSMAAIDQQLTDAVAFEAFIDAKSGGPGTGWFRIVRTPAEARQAIAGGKLAVVLGIEVDNLFNCHWANRADTTGDCSTDGIRRKVKHYYDLGVRHVFPIHNFDNAFGGPATWQDAIDVGNRASEGHWWSPASPTDATPTILDCSSAGYGFKLSCVMQAVIDLLGFPPSVIPLNDPVPCYDSAGATCNTIGLTPRGRDLVQALMDNGMIIDVDHMSISAVNDTLAMAQSRNYPLVASHVQFFDLYESSQRHERMRTRAQLEAIRDLGGTIAAMLKDDTQDSLGGKDSKKNVAYTTSPSGQSIPDNCRHSTKTFGQAYQYAVDVMGKPVALGSDFNGVAGHVGPRFGPDACGGVQSELFPEYKEGNRLQYPFDFGAIGEPGFGTFGKQVTGGKTFDFNVDGLAHIGLLPDLVADLAQVGLPAEYVDQMFLSAEQFIRTWEKSAGVPSGLPTCFVGCGNGQIDAGEDCDGPDLLNGATCQSKGFPGGQLACDASCHFDTSACLTQVCGNGIREGTETCDDGGSNGQPGDCCSDGCQFVADDTSCAIDDNECTADLCRGGACVHPAVADGQLCSDTDGDACTAASCVAGQCDQTTFAADGTACASDQDECTDDLCGSGLCTHPPIPRAATFLSIDCRLAALRATVQSDTSGRVQRTLLGRLDKAIDSKEAAESAAAAGNTSRARSRLRSASRRMINFAYRVTSLAGRNSIMPPAVAVDLLAQQRDILADMDILRGGLQ